MALRLQKLAQNIVTVCFRGEHVWTRVGKSGKMKECIVCITTRDYIGITTFGLPSPKSFRVWRAYQSRLVRRG